MFLNYYGLVCLGGLVLCGLALVAFTLERIGRQMQRNNDLVEAELRWKGVPLKSINIVGLSTDE